MEKKVQTKFKKIITIIANIFLVLLLLIGLLVGFSILPIRNNFKILAVNSGSMEPTIKTGELVIIKPQNNYQVGDIITFNFPNSPESALTTHRIFEKIIRDDIELYKTKGDANNSPDLSLIRKGNILGKYRFGVPYIGYLIGYVKTLPGLVLIIIIPATIIIYEESRKVHKEAKLILKKRRVKKLADKKLKKSKNKSSEVEGSKKGEGSKDAKEAKADN